VAGGKAVEAVLYLIFIASNIMQLFLFRRLKKHFTTQRKMVRLLLNGYICSSLMLNWFLAAYRN